MTDAPLSFCLRADSAGHAELENLSEDPHTFGALEQVFCKSWGSLE
jgi:hypothetical protein